MGHYGTIWEYHWNTYIPSQTAGQLGTSLMARLVSRNQNFRRSPMDSRMTLVLKVVGPSNPCGSMILRKYPRIFLGVRCPTFLGVFFTGPNQRRQSPPFHRNWDHFILISKVKGLVTKVEKKQSPWWVPTFGTNGGEGGMVDTYSNLGSVYPPTQ